MIRVRTHSDHGGRGAAGGAEVSRYNRAILNCDAQNVHNLAPHPQISLRQATEFTSTIRCESREGVMRSSYASETN